jgi:hypothetical protein
LDNWVKEIHLLPLESEHLLLLESSAIVHHVGESSSSKAKADHCTNARASLSHGTLAEKALRHLSHEEVVGNLAKLSTLNHLVSHIDHAFEHFIK